MESEFDYAEFFRRWHHGDKQPQEACCCECGATCTVDEVCSGYEQDSAPPCEHSWFSYQCDGVYILE